MINLVYTLDNNFAMQAGVSLTSLFENNTDIDFNLYIVSDNISIENKERLSRIAKKYKNDITILEMPDLDKVAGCNLALKGWAKPAYCRLFLGDILPEEVDRLLYLDPDTLIVGSVKKLEDVLNSAEFENDWAHACIDYGGAVKRYHGFRKEELYFNSGVMLINLKKWRARGLQKVFEKEIIRRKGASVDPDQSYINCILINRIVKLPAEYNVFPIYFWGYDTCKKGFSAEEIYTEKEIKYAVEHPVIIHFISRSVSRSVIRPWYINSNHPLKDRWNEYLQLTEWKNYKFSLYSEGNTTLNRLVVKVKGVILHLVFRVPILSKIVTRLKHGFFPRLYRGEL